MVQKKFIREVNAQASRYYVAPIKDEELTDEDWLELAEGITTVEPDVTEDVEEFAYYAHRGGKEEVVGSVSQAYTFTGHRFEGDPAQDFVAAKEWAVGDDRLANFKIVDSNGDSFVGQSTITGIQVRGGEANAFRPFSGRIRFVGRPKHEEGTPSV